MFEMVPNTPMKTTILRRSKNSYNDEVGQI